MTDTLGSTSESNVLDPKIRKQLKEARKTAKRVQELQDQLTAKDRELAFARAGIPDDPRGTLFSQAYQGELDPAKIQAAFADIFAVDPATAGDGTETAQRIAGAAQGGGTPGAPGTTDLADALRAARGDNEAVKRLIAEHGHVAGIKLPDID